MQIRDRIVELRRIKASTLLPHPRNWRTHPAAQQDALRGILAEVGYADALLARETPQGIQLIDGHLRAEITPDAEVPVLVLDVTEQEAAKLLATLDPLAAMAEPDAGAFASLLECVSSENEQLAGLLEIMLAEAQFEVESSAHFDGESVLPKAAAVRKLGDKKYQIRPVLYAEQVAVFEDALKRSGKKNRGEALLDVSRSGF